MKYIFCMFSTTLQIPEKTKQFENGGSEEDCVCDLVEFAMTLCQKLQEVNKDAFNTFQLRVGIR